MNKRINRRTICSVLIVVLAVSLIIGCAGKKPPWGDAKTGFVLAYQLQKDQVWKYETKTTQVQALEMMGNAMETSTDIVSNYSIIGVGLDEKNNVTSKIKMASGTIKTKSPQGEQAFDLSAIINKDFGLSFTRSGKKVKFSDPDSIKVDFGPGGKRSSESFFKDPLPRLAQQPVKIGGTWTISQVDTVDEGGMEIVVDMKTTHTLTGLEKVNEEECFKIISKAAFALTGTGERMGASLAMEGDGDVNST